MSLLDGVVRGARSALGITAASATDLTAATVATAPAPQLGSPWADSSALQTIVWSELVAGGSVDAPLARADAMAVPAIARARTVLATTLGRLPILAMDSELADATELRTPDGKLTEAGQFFAQPDPAQPRFIQVTWTVDDLIFQGVSWWLVLARYADGRTVRNARRILPGGVELHDGGKVTVYGQQVNPRDLIRIDGPHEGILNANAATVRTAKRLENAAAKFADNPVPAVELHQTDDYPMTPGDRTELINGWVAARKGANGGVAFTTRNIEAKMHGAPAEHLLTSGRNSAAIDAARVVGTPADSVDASVEHASMTYQTSEGRLRVLVDFGLAAYGAAITARLSMPDVCPRGTFAGFAYDQITAATDASSVTPAPPAAGPSAPVTPAAGGPDQEAQP